nr:MAG TPA: hypothetical protein [Caudoviricetes sp.]
MIGLNKIGLNQVQLNRLHLNAPFSTYRKMAGGGGSGDGFPQLPGDVTRWHFGGLTNEMMAAMDDPRIEDADHKGRFLSFKNFAWSGMSGCGGYDYDFTKKSIFNYSGANTNAKIASDTFYIEKVDNARINISIRLAQFKCRLKITGVSDSINSGEIQLLRMYSNKDFDNRITIKTDGIYDVDIPNQEDELIFIFAVSPQGTIENPLTLTTPITIEQLPFYPGFIIGDGVDDCAVTEKNLDFEDTYTVYTAFIPFKSSTDYPALCGKDYKKDFYINFRGDSLSNINFYSVDKYLFSPLLKGFNLFACKRTANKIVIKNLITGVSKESDIDSFIENPGLYYLWKSAAIAQYAKAAIAGQVICNGHFTTDEEDTKVLNWYKKEYPWLFFDQAWTVTGKTNEDTDRATIANITGNGNDLVLSNFGFAGGSGYGLYAVNFLDSIWVKNTGLTKISPSSFTIENTIESTQATVYINTSGKDVILPSFKVNITGLGNVVWKYHYIDDAGDRQSIILQDGVNVLPTSYVSLSATSTWVGFGTITGVTDNITIEQIPDHDGYLVTDGIDDKVYSSAFALGNKYTVVGENEILSNTYANAGIVKVSSFFVFPNSIGVTCYINRQSKGLAIPSKRLKSICSDGRIYYDDWAEAIDVGGNMESNNPTPLFLGYQNNEFTRFAFKNLAIYNNKTLSKEDAIKAYIYLQTLKAK